MAANVRVLRHGPSILGRCSGCAGAAKGWPGGRGRLIPAREPTEEEIDAAILAKLAAVSGRMVREGWSEAEEWMLASPGWVKRTA